MMRYHPDLPRGAAIQIKAVPRAPDKKVCAVPSASRVFNNNICAKFTNAARRQRLCEITQVDISFHKPLGLLVKDKIEGILLH